MAAKFVASRLHGHSPPALPRQRETREHKAAVAFRHVTVVTELRFLLLLTEIETQAAGCPDAPAPECRSRLVSRFRSSQILAAPSDANFGIKGTLATV